MGKELEKKCKLFQSVTKLLSDKLHIVHLNVIPNKIHLTGKCFFSTCHQGCLNNMFMCISNVQLTIYIRILRRRTIIILNLKIYISGKRLSVIINKLLSVFSFKMNLIKS